MNNAELIKALRWCGGEHHGWCIDETYKCPLWDKDKRAKDALGDYCKEELMTAAADALEAANERIVNLLTALHLANEKLAYVDCQPYTEIDGEEMIEDWVKTLVYEELKEQLPKEAHWVAVENGHGVCSNCNRQDSIDNMATHCRYCGAKMKGEKTDGTV